MPGSCWNHSLIRKFAGEGVRRRCHRAGQRRSSEKILGTMFRMMFVLSGFAAAAVPAVALASPLTEATQPAARAADDGAVMRRPERRRRGLFRRQWQSRDRRCLYGQGHRHPAAADPVRPAGASRGAAPARHAPGACGDDRYYLDDPEDMARFRRRQMDEQTASSSPPVDEYDHTDNSGEPFRRRRRTTGL